VVHLSTIKTKYSQYLIKVVSLQLYNRNLPSRNSNLGQVAAIYGNLPANVSQKGLII